MDNSIIFIQAASDYEGGIKNNLASLRDDNGINSAFGIIDNVISSLSQKNMGEAIKRKELDLFLNKVIASTDNRIMGVKTTTLRTIVNSVNNNYSKKLTMDEFKYYIKYIVRLYKANITGISDSFKLEEEIEKGKLSEQKAREEEVKRKQQEEELKLKEEKLKSMTEGEKVIFELKEKSFEESAISEVINNKIDNLSEEDKKEVALALKDWYTKCGAWNGKPSKKVQAKIEKIKGILK